MSLRVACRRVGEREEVFVVDVEGERGRRGGYAARVIGSTPLLRSP
jgi:hypothetical protein